MQLLKESVKAELIAEQAEAKRLEAFDKVNGRIAKMTDEEKTLILQKRINRHRFFTLGFEVNPICDRIYDQATLETAMNDEIRRLIRYKTAVERQELEELEEIEELTDGGANE